MDKLWLILLACPLFGQIAIQSATYGGNCGAKPGNATAQVAKACDGKTTCDYTVDFRALGDPAPFCAKSFTVSWTDAAKGTYPPVTLPAEAGLGSIAHIAVTTAPISVAASMTIMVGGKPVTVTGINFVRCTAFYTANGQVDRSNPCALGSPSLSTDPTILNILMYSDDLMLGTVRVGGKGI